MHELGYLLLRILLSVDTGTGLGAEGATLAKATTTLMEVNAVLATLLFVPRHGVDT